MADFKLTYATMFNPPDELHTGFDKAVETLKGNLGKEYGMIINGKDVFANAKFEDYSPINTDWKLAVMQKGDARHAQEAIAAARAAFPKWSRTPWQERIKLVRKAASLLEERIFALGAAMALEVGKNRMESLGDVQETADLMYYSALMVEQNNGFIKEMGKDPLVGYEARNVSVLKPYGVWLIISPFNFPFALTGGPTGAALSAGNTVVIKPATDTAWIVRLYAECLRDAGFPDGVINFVTGPGSTLGQALVDNSDVDGATFTGSFDVGMKLYRSFANGKYVRPVILELGGKNPAIVSRNADLERAAVGIVRSAFGLQGQKCSADSRVLVEEPVYDDLVGRLKEMTDKLVNRRSDRQKRISRTGHQPVLLQRFQELHRRDQPGRRQIPDRWQGQDRRHVRQGLLLRTNLRDRPSIRTSPVATRNVRAHHHHWQGQEPGRRHEDRQ